MLATAVKSEPELNIFGEPIVDPSEAKIIGPRVKAIVVTGGAGYIGAHVVNELLKAGFVPVVIDDLSTGSRNNLPVQAVLFEGDFADPLLWANIVQQYEVVAVAHLAAKIDATESLSQAERYLEINFQRTKILLEILEARKINKLVFASTAAVYGDSQTFPITEQTELKPLNPYGESKMLAEQAIVESSVKGLQAIVLRFFNAAGTDPQSLDRKIRPQIQHGLLQQLKAVIDAREPVFAIYGDDYTTPDGTCIRDFVHVVDIARAVVLAVKTLLTNHATKFGIFNVGSEQGHSIKQILQTAQHIVAEQNKTIPFTVAPRRDNEVAVSVADSSLIKTTLNFDLQYSDLETILRTSLL